MMVTEKTNRAMIATSHTFSLHGEMSSKNFIILWAMSMALVVCNYFQYVAASLLGSKANN
jgi:hypothetical protein